MHVKIDVVLTGAELRDPSCYDAPSDVLKQLQMRQEIHAALESKLVSAKWDIDRCRKFLKCAVDNEQDTKRLIEFEIDRLPKP